MKTAMFWSSYTPCFGVVILTDTESRTVVPGVEAWGDKRNCPVGKEFALQGKVLEIC